MVSCFLVVALLASSFGAGCAEGYCASLECQANVLNVTQRSLNSDMRLLQGLVSVERAVTFTIVVELRGTPVVSNKATTNTWASANVDAFKTTVYNTFVTRSLPCGLPTSLGTLAQLHQNDASVLQPTVFITVTGLPSCSDLATFQSKTLLVNAMNTTIQDYVATAPATLYIDNPVRVFYEPGDSTNGFATAPSPYLPDPPPDPAAAAKGDPHLVNLHGEHFDLQQPGVHAMIVIPAFAEKNGALLHVQALAEKKGSKCTDMYLTMINVTGRWVGAQGPNGMDAGTSVQYFAERSQEDIAWKRYGTVSLKVVWGHTPEGVQYLNLLAKNLAHAGHRVGGLLGEYDHTEAARPIPGCRKTVRL